MRNSPNNRSLFKGKAGGFSLIELLVVVSVCVILMAIATPLVQQISYAIRLRSAADALSGLMQQARILAAKKNTIYTIRYRVASGVQEAYIDLNNDNSWQTGEPIVPLGSTISTASGAPSGSGGQPSAYTLVGDSGTTNYDNATVLGYSARGLPCAYVVATGVCATPAAGYFVYYLNDQRGGATGWGGVLVTRSGRTKSVLWGGTSWQ
jgi:prepilin-type N-terminal cleavage/methylation domain-containing protein